MAAALLSALLGAAVLKPGDLAPDFTLPDTAGNQVALSKLLERGPVILIFFPKAFTSGWMKHTAAFRDRNADIEKKGGQVVAISTDDVETLRRFREDRKAPYPFLSDAGGKVARQYAGTIPVLGLANRANYVVGQDRRVVSVVTGDAALDPAASVDACPARKG